MADSPEHTPSPARLPYHKPVMLKECIEQLEMKPSGRYVDCTFGGGGHSELMVQLLDAQGQLYAFDQDPDARRNADSWDYPNFHFIASNFRNLQAFLLAHQALPVDGILADLGISSFQIDEPSKGFSIRFDGPLDMRMNPDQGLDAAHVINTYSLDQLTRIFKVYGEVDNPRRLAERVILERSRRAISTTMQLREALWPLAPRSREFKFLAQVFQAIRIEVNDELKALEEMLEQTAKVLAPGGRLVVLTYHSLEDRLVKNFMAKGDFEGIGQKDLMGNEIRPFEPVWRKAMVPNAQELEGNPRARSAKLRVATKIDTVAKAPLFPKKSR